MLDQNDRDRARKYALSLLGIPYKLGGNVPQDGGLDCSGLCLEIARAMGIWPALVTKGKTVISGDATAQMFHDALIKKGVHVLSPTAYPIADSTFIFYGESIEKITHVAFYIGGNTIIEAGGNDTSGMVRLRKFPYRKDLVAMLSVG